MCCPMYVTYMYVLPYVSVEDSAMSQMCALRQRKSVTLHVKCMFLCISNLIRVREM